MSGTLGSWPATYCTTATTRASAAWCSPRSKGHDSPLRHRPTLASCRTGGHAIWWTVEAGSEQDALALLPFYVAERTTITRVSEVQIP